jgi:general secretion pathway protein G
MWNFGKDMRDINFLDTLLIRGRSQRCVRAFTLVELLVVMALVGTIVAIAVPSYSAYTDRTRNATAAADIVNIGLRIVVFRAEHGRVPNTLAEAGVSILLDPWGRPYEYTRIEGLSKHDMDAKCRWNKFEKPLNTDFDLYSMGKDGKTKPKTTHKDSFDDIIRANNGTFVGLASEH